MFNGYAACAEFQVLIFSPFFLFSWHALPKFLLGPWEQGTTLKEMIVRESLNVGVTLIEYLCVTLFWRTSLLRVHGVLAPLLGLLKGEGDLFDSNSSSACKWYDVKPAELPFQLVCWPGATFSITAAIFIGVISMVSRFSSDSISSCNVCANKILVAFL